MKFESLAWGGLTGLVLGICRGVMGLLVCWQMILMDVDATPLSFL